MKKILYIVLDGLGDGKYPCKELGNRTPLEAASTPAMDMLAREGQSGLMYTVGKDIAPESDIAVISILGYDAMKYYTGRGPLEALAAGIKINDGDLAFRANFATRGTGRSIKDRRVGRNLSTEEATQLCKEIKKKVKLESVPATFTFKNTLEYRGVLVIRDNNDKLSGYVTNTDPAYIKHGLLGVAKETGTFENIVEYCMPTRDCPDTEAAYRSALLVNEFTLKSCEVLDQSEVNKNRIKKGHLPANLVLLRDAGDHLPKLPSIKSKFKTHFGCFVEMPTEEGIALLTGMKIVPIPPPTKDLEKDYTLRANMTIKHMKNYDGLYIHIKGPDVPGHDGDAIRKKAVIEAIDQYYLTPLINSIDLDKTIVAITADHSTPCRLKSHSDDPVPLLICGGNIKPDTTRSFSEKTCLAGKIGKIHGTQLLPLLIKYANTKK
ncbi:MAG: 2,3-bisphosphoglycerate-independent phosphoglycerate mutase [Candidatus Brocadia sp. AMX2]|uniref:Phosphoglycerate mutase AP superfamily n=1 Tax=Candidatus Brocadia sinica JPN1 TaxID=1197129 RepID=A0ABQ0JU85_9BACT|nr:MULTISPECIES: alkaline phosphatase family protein [Brocadia]KXK29855.1 MAG: phosphonopyruvate decarboxylase-related protein [Candidatus Brocadia sinica]MBC6932998.1 2,3-bisphosphoglycerate-independent phosphoglycerate mutase [Candidatus Brocadia sp.]MBL1169304.1 2,3-bisphosphoglycerate-independent phosphoglycerate mutase [Candidatus Brocadia sp. AMX1]NOG41807.1 2,3-bisphosphoglycerate-independent phosphoglycerate mutase [Planctomycetota bacterium]KAA0241942.1 MAG: 2,3-bisphosphoglycerate-in